MRFSVVIPVLNEEGTLEELHRRIVQTLATAGADFELVFVNDGSRDRSAQILASLAAADPRVVFVDLRRNFGKAAALAAGFAEAGGEILVTIDSDLQDVPEEIPKLLARLEEGCDLVTGRKRERRDSVPRRVASWFFNAVVSLLVGARVRDANSGLKVMHREVAEALPLHGDLHRFIPVLAQARGFSVAEVDVAHEARRFGRSRYGVGRYARGMFDAVTVLLLTRYGKRPLHFFGLFGAALTLVGFVTLVYLTIYKYATGEGIGQRPLLVLGVLLVILGIQSAFFGLLAELVVLAGAGKDRGYSVRSVMRGGRSTPGG